MTAPKCHPLKMDAMWASLVAAHIPALKTNIERNAKLLAKIKGDYVLYKPRG